MGNWTPSIVPTDDQTVYLVLDDFGDIGRCWRETDAERVDLETVISDMQLGEFSNSVRIVAFNSAEGWARDISEDIADELRHRCNRQSVSITANLEGFIKRYENPAKSRTAAGSLMPKSLWLPCPPAARP